MTTISILEDTEKLIELLNSVMSTSLEKIRQADQIITELTNTHFDRLCLTLLDNIIIPETASANETIKQMALIILKSSLKKKEKSDSLMNETGNIIRQKCLGLMFSPSVGIRLQGIIAGILEILYSQPLAPHHIQTDLVNIKHYVATNKNNTPLFLTMQALGYLNPRTKVQITEQFDELLAWLVDIGNQEICAVQAEIQKFQTTQHYDSNILKEKIGLLVKWLDAVRQFVVNEFGKEGIEEDQLSLLQEKVYYQRLPGILSVLLTMNFSDAMNNPLIPSENNSPDAEQIKTLKTQTLDILTLLIDILEPFSKIDITKFPIYQALENDTLRFVFNELVSFLQSPEYIETFENDDYSPEENEEVIKNAIIFLKQTLRFKQNFDLGLPITE